jgi:predicted PurR-regulated permease PerM
VIGGTISYGLVGLFLGPIVLAVFYELVVAWVQLGTADEMPAAP